MKRFQRMGHGFPPGIFVVKPELKNIASLEPQILQSYPLKMPTGLQPNKDNRISRFPGTKPGEAGVKRSLAELEAAVQGTKESARRLQKRQALLPQLSKEAANPWERYQKSFKINQAGSGFIVHANDETFREGVLKAVKTSKGELSKVINSPHRNLVHLHEALYHDAHIFFLYEVMDISLAQIFSSPLGRLQLFEVAAFSKEILAGVQHIHDSLKITHGDLTSNNILLSVTGAIKIGMGLA
jgi:serine/threonine protein kinase